MDISKSTNSTVEPYSLRHPLGRFGAAAHTLTLHPSSREAILGRVLDICSLRPSMLTMRCLVERLHMLMVVTVGLGRPADLDRLPAGRRAMSGSLRPELMNTTSTAAQRRLHRLQARSSSSTSTCHRARCRARLCFSSTLYLVLGSIGRTGEATRSRRAEQQAPRVAPTVLHPDFPWE